MKKFIGCIEGFLEYGGTKKDVMFLVLSGIAMAMSLMNVNPFPFDIAWVAIVLCGLPIILEAVIGLVTSFDIKADVLVSLALIASICIHEDFAAGEVAFIMQIGALLEDLTVAKARNGIEKLVRLTPQTARVMENGMEKIIAAADVKKGIILRVLPGETIPVDGVILTGTTSVNQSVMTGESMPIDKTVGDEVSSGTVNQYGAFEVKTVRVGEDSSIQRMIRLVQSADAGKAGAGAAGEPRQVLPHRAGPYDRGRGAPLHREKSNGHPARPRRGRAGDTGLLRPRAIIRIAPPLRGSICLS